MRVWLSFGAELIPTPEVRGLYAELNRSHFDSALPTDLPVGICDEEQMPPGVEALADLIEGDHIDGCIRVTPQALVVRRSVFLPRDHRFRRAVLHEMAHVATCSRMWPLRRRDPHRGERILGGHDGAFLERIESLEARGEAWAPEEINRYVDHLLKILNEEQPLGWEALRQQAHDDEGAEIADVGWLQRVAKRAGVLEQELDRHIAGPGFWYRRFRLNVRRGRS